TVLLPVTDSPTPTTLLMKLPALLRVMDPMAELKLMTAFWVAEMVSGPDWVMLPPAVIRDVRPRGPKARFEAARFRSLASLRLRTAGPESATALKSLAALSICSTLALRLVTPPTRTLPFIRMSCPMALRVRFEPAPLTATAEAASEP